MANSYTELHYHCIWSTKERRPLIRPEIEETIWNLVAATAIRHGMKILRIGGIENHVHVLLEIPKNLAVSEAMKQLKGGSSNAINQAGILADTPKFQWQKGYGAFTVSSSQIPVITKYIANQREHHKTQTFEEEFVAFLAKHGIEYDPQYLWD